MKRLIVPVGLAVALFGQDAVAKSRLTDPIKIARECKSELELMCKGVRPGRQRIVTCLRSNEILLSPACQAALKSAE